MLGGRTAGSAGLAINQHINATLHQLHHNTDVRQRCSSECKTVSTVCPSMLRRIFRSVNDLVFYSTKMSESIPVHD